MSDSIVQILTLKFLGCFLNSELNPIFAAKALAIASCSVQSVQLVQVVKLKKRGVECHGIVSVTPCGVDGR